MSEVVFSYKAICRGPMFLKNTMKGREYQIAYQKFCRALFVCTKKNNESQVLKFIDPNSQSNKSSKINLLHKLFYRWSFANPENSQDLLVKSIYWFINVRKSNNLCRQSPYESNHFHKRSLHIFSAGKYLSYINTSNNQDNGG